MIKILLLLVTMTGFANPKYANDDFQKYEADTQIALIKTMITIVDTVPHDKKMEKIEPYLDILIGMGYRINKYKIICAWQFGTTQDFNNYFKDVIFDFFMVE